MPKRPLNPWLAQVMEVYRCAHHAWWLEREAVCMGYATEEEEYALEHPEPQLKDFLREMSDREAS